jgi:LysR family transcriptional regulator, nitrogen assimilation regulatory protein
LHPKKLDHFLKIVQAGSLSRAADRMNISQPALSRELRELEAEMGAKLLRRHARGVGLTTGGEAFKKRAELILGLLDTIRDEVHAAADQPSGRVAFGLPASMSGCLAVPLVRDSRQKHPLVRLQVREGTSYQLRSALLARELDFAVLTAPVSEPQLIVRPLLTEPFVIVGPVGSPLTGRRQIALEEVTTFPLILPMMPNATRILIETAFERAGHVPKIALETDMAPFAEFISDGVGYAILPACSVSSKSLVTKGMVDVPIKGLTLTRLLASPAGVSMSLATHRLSQMLCEHTRTQVLEGRLRGQYVGP